jgi:hypothetical protein
MNENEKLIITYVLLIKRGKITLNDVPSELKEQVESKL